MSHINWRKYQQLTTPDEAARWYAVDPENPQARVIAFRPKVKRRKAEKPPIDCSFTSSKTSKSDRLDKKPRPQKSQREGGVLKNGHKV
jgi:hypothetical protein